jgi:FkbH-like protein
MNAPPAFLKQTEFTREEAEAASGHLQELRCTQEGCAAVERFAGGLSEESANIWRKLLENGKPSNEMSLWLLGGLQSASGATSAAADTWTALQWTAEGDGRAPVLLALAGALIKCGRTKEAWHALAGAARSAGSARILRQIDRHVERLRREGAAVPSKRQSRVALLGSVTLDMLGPVLRAQCFGAGIDVAIYVAPFDQIVQEIENAGSGLAKFRPDIIVIAPDWRWLRFGDDEADPQAAVAQRLSQLERLWFVCRDRLASFVVQASFEVPLEEPWGRLSMALPGGRSRLLRGLNLAMWDAASGSPGVAILDLEQVAAAYGKQGWSDPVLWHVAKQYPAADALVPLGRELTAILRAIHGLTAKCVVLDLDNTLWGGVIGEDGLSGIQLGGSPAGEAFVTFQRYLKSLSARGVLLAVCSKNNEEDARRPFQEHPEMVLRESDIACFVANWSAKYENLPAIARAINIGIDALVFVDDNPVERAAVRMNVPEVEVIELPVEPAHYVSALDRSKLFEVLALTDEDRARTSAIRGNIEREQMASASGDVGEYLAGLGMRVELSPFDEANLPRIVQLINKTNQFNLTTRRRTDTEVRGLLAAGVYTQAMRVSDRFGDNGLTGVLIALPEGDALRLDTWLMSCRVMGRRLEEAMFAALTRYACAQGFRSVDCQYIPTAKNSVVADLFTTLGCDSLGEEAGARIYRWAGETPLPSPDVLQVEDRTAADEPDRDAAARKVSRA